MQPERVYVIKEIPAPKNKEELLRFLDMVNFSSRFIPKKSEVLEPLTALLKKNVLFTWDKAQEHAFVEVKELLAVSPCLAYFDPNQIITVSADASGYGLGTCLYQQVD